MNYAVFTSWGNDSIALIQHLHEEGATGVFCAFSETHWGVPWWAERVAQGEDLARRYGFVPVRIDSVGMVPLVRLKKAWPRQGMQFCTEELKIKPAMAWLDHVDPEKDLTCAVGVRREESRSRMFWPEWTEESDKHGGRDLWSPLVRLREAERNELCDRAGFEILKHRSMECYPCINSNRTDLRTLSGDETRIGYIEEVEKSMGVTSKGKPRVMFRPYKKMKATGIREVIKWAESNPGKYEPPTGGCDGGFCGL